MRKIKLLVATMLLSGLFTAGYGQQSQSTTQPQAEVGSPQAFKYQAIARNANGEAIANQNVSFRISILEGSATGTTVYEETQIATTNQFGLANLSIGMGTPTNGTFSSIQWGNNTYFVKVEFDPQGGTNFTFMGTSQMLSVPYSLYSEHAKTADNLQNFPVKAALQGTNLQAPFDAPETGMLVYNTDSAGSGNYAVVPGYYYNAGTATDPNWIALSVDDNGHGNHRALATCNSTLNYWGIAGNSGTTAGTDFIGTCDGADVVFMWDNISSGVLDDINYNTCFGVYTGVYNMYGQDNTGIGYGSLESQTASSGSNGSYNTGCGVGTLSTTSTGMANSAFGYDALLNGTGSDNTACGAAALHFLGSGDGNTAVGWVALENNTANLNTAVGDSCLTSNTSGSGNVAMGYQAMYSNTTATQNTAMGYQALTNLAYSNSSTPYTGECVAIGYQALYSDAPNGTNAGVDNTGEGWEALYYNVTGDWNTATGRSALYGSSGNSFNASTADGYAALYQNTGNDNTAVGYEALYNMTSGTENTAIGYTAGPNSSSTTVTNTSALGYDAVVTNSDMIELGNCSVTFTGANGASYSSTKAFAVGCSSSNGNGAYLTLGGTWTNASDSNKKENFTTPNGTDILNKIMLLPVLRWNYRGEAQYIQHIGPMAQDFYRIFNVGNDSLSISTIDPAGIALIGVQTLNRKLEAENASLKLQLAQLQNSQGQLQNSQENDEKQIAELKKAIEIMTQQASIKK